MGKVRPNRRVKVEVTVEDLALGKRRSQLQCPLARAIGRRLSPDYYASVGAGAITIFRSMGKKYGKNDRPVLHADHTRRSARLVDEIDHHSKKTQKPSVFTIQFEPTIYYDEDHWLRGEG